MSLGRQRNDHRSGRWALAVLVGSLAVVGPLPAAQAQLPSDNSGIDEYVETVPGAEGSRQPGKSKRTAPLPENVRRGLPPGGEGELLTRLATAEGLGAPLDRGSQTATVPDGAPDESANRSGRERPDSSGGEDRGAPGAVASALTDSDDPGIPLLVAALLLLTLAAAVAALMRRRRGQG